MTTSIDCRRRAFILGLILLLPSTAMVADEPASRVLRVGPQHALKTPSAAARVAQDGDTVEIEGGDYVGDVASWRQNRLTLRGVNGRPHLMAGGKSAERKAIWVIKGAAVVVDNIEFSGVRVPGFAGAGIRSKGGEAIIRDNDLLQGAEAPNRTAIAFAPEAKDKSAPGFLVVSHNRFINEGGPGTFERNHATLEAVLNGNELTGLVRPLRGPGRVR